MSEEEGSSEHLESALDLIGKIGLTFIPDIVSNTPEASSAVLTLTAVEGKENQISKRPHQRKSNSLPNFGIIPA
jgi:hypothetical protein